MSDLVKEKPVRTVRDDRFKVQIADGASGSEATNKLSIQLPGTSITAGDNDFGIPVLGEDASGNYTLLKFTANGLEVDPGTVTVTATSFDIRPLAFATDSVDVSGSSVTVSATDLDIRQLIHTGVSPDSVQIGDGTEVLSIAADGQAEVSIADAQAVIGATAPAEVVQVGGVDDSGNAQTFNVNTDGSINAAIVPNPDESGVNDFGSGTANEDAAYTYDYVVTSGKTFKGSHILIGSDYRVKISIGYWDGTLFTEKARWYQDPTENRQVEIPKFELLGDGTAAIRAVVTNVDDDDASDIAVNLQGIEA